MCITELLCSTAEISTTLYINQLYFNLKKKENGILRWSPGHQLLTVLKFGALLPCTPAPAWETLRFRENTPSFPQNLWGVSTSLQTDNDLPNKLSQGGEREWSPGPVPNVSRSDQRIRNPGPRLGEPLQWLGRQTHLHGSQDCELGFEDYPKGGGGQRSVGMESSGKTQPSPLHGMRVRQVIPGGAYLEKAKERWREKALCHGPKGRLSHYSFTPPLTGTHTGAGLWNLSPACTWSRKPTHTSGHLS